MASFTPPDPPFVPDEPTPPPTLNVPYPPPEVGEGSPWAAADSENRDRILDWWRMWFRRVFFPWIAAFTTYWDTQWNRLATYINTWIAAADTYISEHAIAGYGFRPTATDIAGSGTTEVTFTDVDTELRPVIVGDLALDESLDGNFGIVTIVIDATHATVQYLGSLRGLAGLSWRLTATPIADSGTTNVVLTADTLRPFALGDLVLDSDADGNFGIVTALIDATHVTVTFAGSLRGPQGAAGVNGLSWRYTDTAIAGIGTTDVTFTDPVPPLQLGDLVTDTTGSGNVAAITALIDATHATVTYLENLKGAPGVIASIVAGSGITIDDTDPANPIISSAGSTVEHFTDYGALDGAHTLPDGTMAVVNDVLRQITSLWVLTKTSAIPAGLWSAIQIQLTTNIPSEWANLVSTITFYTHLSLEGATFTEGPAGSYPQWATEIAAVVQDPGAHLYYTYDGVETFPTGSWTASADNTIVLDDCQRLEINPALKLPGFDIDLTDSYDMHLWGQMSANADVTMQMVLFSTGLIDEAASNYLAFGKDLEMNAGVVTETTFAQNFGAQAYWNLAHGSDGSPTYVDLTLRVRHVATTEDGYSTHGAPMIGELECYFYTDPSLGSEVVYKRTMTLMYYGTNDDARALILAFGGKNFFGNLTFTKVAS